MNKHAQPMQFAVWGAREYLSVIRSILTGQVRVGPNVAKLQRKFATIYGQSTVLPVNAGRTALRLALGVFAMHRPERRRVLMPEYLCPSAVDVVRDLGLEPWPVKVGADLNLDPDDLNLDDSVLAVVAAHMYGCPARIGEIERRCRAAGVFLIDDAAQVVGVCSDGRMLGTFGDLGIVSFAQSKTVVTGIRGSGGLLLINNVNFHPSSLQSYSELRPPLNRLTSFTLFVVEYLLAGKLGSAGYYVSRIANKILPGFNKSPYSPALLGNLEAGIAIAQLERLQQVLSLKRGVADLYAAALSKISAIKIPQHAPGRFLSRIFIEFTDPQTAFIVRRGLQSRKISTRLAYPPWTEKEGISDTNSIANRLVEMPSRVQMTEADVAWVSCSIHEILNETMPRKFSKAT